MASFVMIHGAWHGGWCFDPLRQRLEGAGHRLIAPDLPGMGGDEETLGRVTLDGWAQFVADLCRAQRPDPVILCGHSRGGLVISQAAEAAPEAIDALVYLCAMLLPPGMSRAAWKADQLPNPDFEAIIAPTDSGNGTVIDRAGAAAVFAQLSPPDLAAAAMARLVADPVQPQTAPLHLTDARYGSVPRHYVECRHDRTIALADQRRMQAAQPCATVTALDADHSPFLSAPAALAETLLSIAVGATR
jgi:pimeloyl-ACP methyl ester carboxylesterase